MIKSLDLSGKCSCLQAGTQHVFNKQYLRFEHGQGSFFPTYSSSKDKAKNKSTFNVYVPIKILKLKGRQTWRT